MNYLVVFRTHVWDSDVAEIARRAAKCCRAGQFVVVTDDTKGPIAVDTFHSIGHTADFSAFSLPAIPVGRSLWWNGDYDLYFVRRKMPDFDYYVTLEYDVLLHCDLDRIIADCSEKSIDFVAHDIRAIDPLHWARSSGLDMAENPLVAFVPLVIASARAADFLLQTRQAMAEQLREGRITRWPHCEVFFPTALAKNSTMSMANLRTYVNVDLLRHRPFLSLRDKRLSGAEFVAHPVLRGRRLIETVLSTTPAGSHLRPDGKLLPELLLEDPADILAVVGDHFDMTTVEPTFDVARNRQATQSSHSKWSRAKTAEDDARRAISGLLPPDFAFHTGVEQDPWWCADLLGNYIIKQIEILNRPLVENRFVRFRIEASTDNVNWSIELTKTDTTPVSSDPSNPELLTMPRLFVARYVRIVLIGFESLSLRRVRILGTPSWTAVPGSEQTAVQVLDHVMADKEGRQRFVGAVAATVNWDMFGRAADSYNVDSLAFLAAGVAASQYAVANMTNAERFDSAERLRDHAASLTPDEGLILEFGVSSGRSVNQLALRFRDRRVYGFDSFEGLPETWRPGFKRGAFRTEPPPVHDNVDLVVGWFDQTLPGFIEAHSGDSVALLHVDCDLYSSTKTVLDLLAPMIRIGTIIVFDEYFNYPEWMRHEYKAFQEFVSANLVEYDYVGVVPGHQQVCVRIADIGRK